MSDAVITALISGAVTLIGVVLSYRSAVSRVRHDMQTQQAVMQSELVSLKDDVREHNHYAKLFAESMPVVQEQIKVINHRIADLERDRRSA